ncbi:MAG: hypothetical protein ACK40Z_11145 [Dietzia sp.]
MDPITLLIGLGAAIMPFLGPAAAFGITPLAAGIGAAGLGTGSAVSALGLGGAAAANPFTGAALQSASADGFNNGAAAVAGAVNGLNIPGVHININ